MRELAIVGTRAPLFRMGWAIFRDVGETSLEIADRPDAVMLNSEPAAMLWDPADPRPATAS